MEKKYIDKFNFSTLIFFVLIGTSAIYGFGEARQDTWIVIALSTMLFLIIFLIYIYIEKSYNYIRFTEVIELVFGKWLGKFIVLLYGIYFIYIASRNATDILHFSSVVILYQAPSYAGLILILTLSTYALFKGIHVISKSAKYVFIIVISLYFIILGLVILNNLICNCLLFERLTPILEEGWQPIIRAVSTSITFPFGELIVLLMIVNLIKNKKNIKLTFIKTIIITSIFFIFVMTLTLMYVGPDVLQNNYFAILKLVTGLEIPLLQRIDPFVVSVAVMGAFYKHVLFLYGGVVALQDFFSLKTEKILIIPSVIIVFISSYFMTKNFTTNLVFGLEIVPYYIHYPMQIGIPIIMSIVIFIKKRFINN